MNIEKFAFLYQKSWEKNYRGKKINGEERHFTQISRFVDFL